MLIPRTLGRVLYDRPALAPVLGILVMLPLLAGEYYTSVIHWQSVPWLLRVAALAVLDVGGVMLFGCLTGYQVAISGVYDRMLTRGASQTGLTALVVLEMLHLLGTFFYWLVLVILHPEVLDPVRG